MSSNFHVILARPYTADNIGAVARAMKNMGMAQLRLVSPRPRWRMRAERLARSAADVLEQAEVYSNIREAVGDLNFVIGTTARKGHHRGQFLEYEDAVTQIKSKMQQQKVGVMFGRESKGMNNEEADACDFLMSIPSHSSYASLNLAQAVMVTLFSIAQENLSAGMKTPTQKGASRLITKSESEMTLKHFEKALQSLGFSMGTRGKVSRISKLMESIFKRAGMMERDAQMIKGLSRRICEKLSK